MQDSLLQTPIEYLYGVGPFKGALLRKELGIKDYAGLLMHFPFKYIDRTQFCKIKDIGDHLPYVQVLARLTHKEMRGKQTSKRLIARAQDDTGIIELIWFQSISWVHQSLFVGKAYIIFGKPSFFNGQVQIVHPEMELYSKAALQKKGNQSLQPVYMATEKLKQASLHSKGLQALITTLLDQCVSHIVEILPDDILQEFRLMKRADAFLNIHLPGDYALLHAAQRRLKFEELFFVQFKLLKNKLFRTQKFKGPIFAEVGTLFTSFYRDQLPFQLTNAQKRVLKEIRRNTREGVHMNRLLQGDVGSGKSIVAFMSMLLAIDNGFQACIMAPTEILAKQHYQSLKSLLQDADLSIELLTGSATKKEREKVQEELENGSLKLLVGTHALLNDRVQFQNLGLAVIDEQHRFGVAQRAQLWRKGIIPPHVLVMTATPIPRTLAMTLYVDLDISVLDELPADRKPIQTFHFFESQRLRLFGLMKREIAKGRQVYVVYPLIEESKRLDLKNLTDGIVLLSREFPPPNYKISVMHGKLTAAEKDFEMQRFITGGTHIMIATTAIEVGVNVPNASVMVIEHAECFGLSQLHQLRGRVGRSAHPSFCILMSGHKISAEGKARLDSLVRTQSGFEIAEIDLQLRGPGNFEGTEQSGTLGFKLANLATDQTLLQDARRVVKNIFIEDPELSLPKYAALCHYIQKDDERFGWGKIS